MGFSAAFYMSNPRNHKDKLWFILQLRMSLKILYRKLMFGFCILMACRNIVADSINQGTY